MKSRKVIFQIVKKWMLKNKLHLVRDRRLMVEHTKTGKVCRVRHETARHIAYVRAIQFVSKSLPSIARSVETPDGIEFLWIVGDGVML